MRMQALQSIEKFSGLSGFFQLFWHGKFPPAGQCETSRFWHQLTIFDEVFFCSFNEQCLRDELIDVHSTVRSAFNWFNDCYYQEALLRAFNSIIFSDDINRQERIELQIYQKSLAVQRELFHLNALIKLNGIYEHKHL